MRQFWIYSFAFLNFVIGSSQENLYPVYFRVIGDSITFGGSQTWGIEDCSWEKKGVETLPKCQKNSTTNYPTDGVCSYIIAEPSSIFNQALKKIYKVETCLWIIADLQLIGMSTLNFRMHQTIEKYLKWIKIILLAFYRFSIFSII